MLDQSSDTQSRDPQGVDEEAGQKHTDPGGIDKEDEADFSDDGGAGQLDSDDLETYTFMKQYIAERRWERDAAEMSELGADNQRVFEQVRKAENQYLERSYQKQGVA